MSLLGSPVTPSGGVFRLDRPSAADVSRSIANGWYATLAAGESRIVVHGPPAADNYTDSLSEAVSAAQEALDLLAVEGGVALAVGGAETEHLIWWTEGRGVTLRDVAIEDLKVSISATAVVRDAAGNIKPPPATPALGWHESFRYFRMSQTTGDLFDAYRNLYLAVESLLSTVVPVNLKPDGSPNEGEGKWLRRALTQIHPATIDLAGYALPGPATPVDAVYADLYAGTRTKLFHSKAGRPILLPHTMDGREAVLASLERLGRLYVDLSRSVLGLQRGMGVMTYKGFELATARDGELSVSDDTAPAESSDTIVNPTGGSVFTFSTTRPPELARPGLTTWFGECNVPDLLAQIREVRRVGLAVEGSLMLVGDHSPALTLEGIDVYQVQRSLQLVNQQTVKFRYVT
jgi:hypothetical protein